jgi:hypothetical protein
LPTTMETRQVSPSPAPSPETLPQPDLACNAQLKGAGAPTTSLMRTQGPTPAIMST